LHQKKPFPTHALSPLDWETDERGSLRALVFFFKCQKIERWYWELFEMSFSILAKNLRLRGFIETLGDALTAGVGSFEWRVVN
jgi:hypothetical protein